MGKNERLINLDGLTEFKINLPSFIDKEGFIKKTELGTKQDKIDDSIVYSDEKTVVGAINKNKQRIDNLFAIGRYLAVWNAATGLPTSNPSGTPYPYKAGDWFIVGIVADEGGTNYMPYGTEYTGEASTMPYTEDVPLKVGDRFFFDGEVWKPLVATYPDDNNVKYDEQTLTPAQKLQARTNIGAQDELFEKGTGENSVVQRGTGCSTENSNAIAVGSETKASGWSSLSTGCQTNAIGSNSSTFGYATYAAGDNSMAIGNDARALGEGSFAEGHSTRSWGRFSHTEGESSLTDSDFSHAEGYGCRVETDSSCGHAEGYQSKVYEGGSAAHAEGYQTLAQYTGSHSEGGFTKAIANYAHAEGTSTIAEGKNSHAEGDHTRTSNESEHAEGSFNISNQGTRHSVGIGDSDANRKNAFEIMQNGDVYVVGLGGYNGTNAGATGVLTLQQIINAITI